MRDLNCKWLLIKLNLVLIFAGLVVAELVVVGLVVAELLLIVMVAGFVC